MTSNNDLEITTQMENIEKIQPNPNKAKWYKFVISATWEWEIKGLPSSRSAWIMR